MSLIKQLWIGMILLLLLALGGSFIVSLMSAEEYLRNQLKIKNIDDANALALSISQMEKDSIDIELIITAQFDAGHYEYIMFNDQHKKPVAVRQFDEQRPSVPDWFAQHVDLEAAPGVALIQDGWQQYGSIIVKSHSRFALESLWNQAQHLLEWFLFSCLLASLLGIFVFRRISTPLQQVITQAEAISERRFIRSQEPSTTEFRRLVKAMNRLTDDVETMLEKDSRQLEMLRRDSLLDPLTELNNRHHFMYLLDNLLNRDDSQTEGVLIICRVMRLQELNGFYGHNAVDKILKDIAHALHYFCQQYPGSYAGRLNGSDFAIAVPSQETMDLIGADLIQRLNFQLIAHDRREIAIPMAITQYHHQDDRHHLMHQLDGALAQAEMKGDHAMIACLRDKTTSHHRNLNDWRAALDHALQHQHLSLAQFSVKNTQGELLHYEAPVRIHLDGEEKSAGYFLPWASRLNLLAQIDIQVVKLALEQLNHSASPVAINMSTEALCNMHFREELIDLLAKTKSKSGNLWIEFPEVAIIRYPSEFRSLATKLRELGCKIGLEHAGLEFTQFDQLRDAGIHYLKIDSAITRDIDKNLSNQTFIQGLCQIGHSLGIKMIAEGVTTETEKITLEKMGADGFTGPLIK